MLLERDLELSELGDTLSQAQQGRGRLVVIEAPAGLGKTSLLRVACDLAAEAGVERHHNPGDAIVVPANVQHAAWNAGDRKYVRHAAS